MQAQSADGVIHDFPDNTDPSVIDRVMKDYVQQSAPSSFMDAIKGIPRNLAAGVLDAATTGGQAEALSMSQPDLAAQIPNTAQALKAIEPVTGKLYEPQTALGQIVGSGARMLTNPASYVGPGSIPLKIGGALLSGAGSEAGGQLAQGTSLETPARLAGGLAGGIAAAKSFGPTAERAAIPTAAELKAEEDRLYSAARNSGAEFNPDKLAAKATEWEQKLTNGPQYAFTGGQDGTAPKTLALLDKLKNPPESTASSFGKSAVADALGLPAAEPQRSTITAANLDTIRRQINNIAGETKDFKPTADAKAAMVLKRDFANYLENPPANHIVAGDAANFVRNLKEANATHAALSRLSTIDTKASAAENATNRQVAGSLDSQIKSKIGGLLDKPKSLRGFNQAEKDQIQLINNGTLPSNIMRQAGRGGAGVIPIGTHLATAVATHGASIPYSLAVGVPLYAARKAAERMTVSRANELADMLAKRSPLYERRARGILPPDLAPNKAALARGLLAGLH